MFVTLITQAIKFGIVFLFGSTGEIIIENPDTLIWESPALCALAQSAAVLAQTLQKTQGLQPAESSLSQFLWQCCLAR